MSGASSTSLKTAAHFSEVRLKTRGRGSESPKSESQRSGHVKLSDTVGMNTVGEKVTDGIGVGFGVVVGCGDSEGSGVGGSTRGDGSGVGACEGSCEAVGTGDAVGGSVGPRSLLQTPTPILMSVNVTSPFLFLHLFLAVKKVGTARSLSTTVNSKSSANGGTLTNNDPPFPYIENATWF